MTIAEALARTRTLLADACRAAGRPPEAAMLVAVSKTQPPEAVRAAYQAGQRHFGENRVQEMAAKWEALRDLPDLAWHQIGQLQTNKVKYLAPFVTLVHTLDSVKLLAEIDRQAARHQRQIDCLVQLNISAEDQKAGTDRAGLDAILSALPLHPNVRVLGLMGIAQLTDDAAVVSAQFRQLADSLAVLRSAEGPQVQAVHLSMGMSGDYGLAVAAGATLVRIGSAIFGERNGGR